VSSDFADHSSLSHWVIAVVSVAVGAEGSATIGLLTVPSRCPQNPLALTVSWKRKTKMAQLDLEASSFSTDEGRALERAAVVIEDIVSRSRRFRVKQ
jgi:hypothetical protein